jgi:hypothetical protein
VLGGSELGAPLREGIAAWRCVGEVEGENEAGKVRPEWGGGGAGGGVERWRSEMERTISAEPHLHPPI